MAASRTATICADISVRSPSDVYSSKSQYTLPHQEKTATTLNKTKTTPATATPATAPGSGLPQYLSGTRLVWLLTGLYFAAFLAQMEISVVITALVSITNDLQDFGDATWVVNAYLLTWSGFLILWSQFSKVIGRLSCLILAMLLFVVFSIACAVAQTTIQLVIFRALQGIGGAGVYNLSVVMFCEAVPPSQFPKVTGIMSLSVGLAFAAGPLIGGAIATKTTWRWVFGVNAPAGALTIVTCLLSIPCNFPHHHLAKDEQPKFNFVSLKRLDYLGAVLFLALSTCLVTALQEAGVDYEWSSPTIIVLIVIAILSLIFFIIWQWLIFSRALQIVPMIDWRYTRRKSFGLLSSALVLGVPYTTAFVQIPLRYQVENGLSPFEAGVRLMAYIVMIPFGIFIGTVFVGKFKMSYTSSALIGGVLQLIATTCFAAIPYESIGDSRIPTYQYGLQIILGVGSGIGSSVATSAIPEIVNGEESLMAPLSGISTQFRFTGGAIGLGIVTTAFNMYIRPRLAALLPAETVELVLKSTTSLDAIPSTVETQILQIFVDGFQLQWKIIAGITGLQLLTCLFAI